MCPAIRRTATLAVIALAMPAARTSAQDAETKPPEVRTSASAVRWVVPDLASFRVTLQGKGPTPLKAAQAVAGKALRLRNVLATLGVHPDSVVNPRTWYWQGRVETSTVQRVVDVRDAATGRIRRVLASDTVCYDVNRNTCDYRPAFDTVYQATDELEVRIRNLAVLGAAIDSVLAAGIPSIHDVKAIASDVSVAYGAALRAATEECVRRARQIAEASGGELGAPLSIGTDFDRESPRSFQLTQVLTTGASEEPGTRVLVPNIQVTATVYGRWRLRTR